MIKRFFEAGVISCEENENLKFKYEGFFRIRGTLPDPSKYPNLYRNYDFIKFSNKWMNQRKYFFAAILILFILMSITALS